jgi:hypothetical protein
MTDIDALIDAAEEWVEIAEEGGKPIVAQTYRVLVGALTAERARVVGLEAELQQHKKYDLQSAKCIADLNRDVVRWADEAATERALSDRLAGAIEAYQNATPRYDWNHGLDAALTAHTEAREGDK